MPVITLYALSTCPWCRKAKQFFTERGIPFSFTDYDLADAETRERITAEMDAAGITGFPYVRIDDQIVGGYKPAEYRRLLGLEE
ncbi:MAG: glutaredoxin family protein [Anaerolineae bacterium]|jgi:glutaredoxin|nr:glutaredoxin family protein [Chloroflexota bacterium]